MYPTIIGARTMSKKPRRRFDPEFAEECAKLVLDKGYTQAEAAKAMSISTSSIERWVSKVKRERSGYGVNGNPISEEQREIAKLKKQVKRLEQEKDILKKASALLMSDNMNGFH